MFPQSCALICCFLRFSACPICFCLCLCVLGTSLYHQKQAIEEFHRHLRYVCCNITKTKHESNIVVVVEYIDFSLLFFPFSIFLRGKKPGGGERRMKEKKREEKKRRSSRRRREERSGDGEKNQNKKYNFHGAAFDLPSSCFFLPDFEGSGRSRSRFLRPRPPGHLDGLIRRRPTTLHQAERLPGERWKALVAVTQGPEV